MSGGQRFGDFDGDYDVVAQIAADLGARVSPPLDASAACALCGVPAERVSVPDRRTPHFPSVHWRAAPLESHKDTCEWKRRASGAGGF